MKSQDELYEQLTEMEKQISVHKYELEIEKALDKVRTRTLRMQKSEELGEVARVMYDELCALGVHPEGIIVMLLNDETKEQTQWGVRDEQMSVDKLVMPYIDHPVMQQVYEAQRHGVKFIERHFDKQAKDSFLDIVYASTHYRNIPEEYKAAAYGGKYYHYSFALGQDVGLLMHSMRVEKFPEQHNQILIRFANAFEQTYVRFMDLQKAEAQAREAEIELGLERVRATTMAMIHHDDLLKVTDVLAGQLIHLGIDLDGVSFCNGLHYGDWDLWITTPVSETARTTVRVKMPWFDHPYFHKTKLALDNYFANGVDLVVEVFTKEEKDSFTDYSFRDTGFSQLVSEEAKKFLYSKPGYTWSTIFLKDTWVSICKYDITPFTDEQNAVIRRFATAFGQAYARFLDLQKAEELARESRIQLALERVRAKTMGMQKSADLKDVVKVVFKNLEELEFTIDGAAFLVIPTETSKENDIWIGDNHGDYPTCFRIPYYEAPPIMDIWMAKESGLDFYSKTYENHDKNGWFEYAFEHTDLRSLPGDLKSRILQQEFLTQSFAIARNSMIGIHHHARTSLDESEIDILKRFCNVFEQAYVRFLDLEQAEQQARAAEIELGLERVRAATMAMKTQQDLLTVTNVFTEELVRLGLDADVVNFCNGNGEGDWDLWMTTLSSSTTRVTRRLLVPRIKHPLFDQDDANRINFQKHGINFSAGSLNKADKDSFINHLLTNTNRFENLPTHLLQYLYDKPGFTHSTMHLPDCWVSISKYDIQAYTEEQNQIFRKFTAAFGPAYTRFIDLQKAEAAARESQIELSLERVRAKTMAMQNQNDLLKVTDVFVEQLSALGIDLDGVIFGNGHSYKDLDIWMTTPVSATARTTVRMSIPWMDHPYFWQLTQALDKYLFAGIDLTVAVFNKEEKAGFLDHMFRNTKFAELVDEAGKAFMREKPGYTWSMVILKDTSVAIARHSLTPFTDDENAILRRFAAAFGQAYTRFLDLQKAEAQAKEAEIELGLERVRASTMAMKQHTDLLRVIDVLAEQLIALGFDLDIVNFSSTGPSYGDWDLWITIPVSSTEKYIDRMFVPWIDHPYFEATKTNLDKFFADGTDLFVNTFSKDEKDSFLNYLFVHTKFKDLVTEESKAFFYDKPGYTWSAVMLKETWVSICKYDNVPFTDEQNMMLKRFSVTFGQAYARFIDLQKAEAQAREAQIQLALERVRARTMAMQHSDELRSAAALLFQQVKQLGAPAYSCGYNLWEKHETEFTSWMSTQDGSEINGVPNIPLTEDANFIRYVESKENGEAFFVLELRGERMQEHYRYLTTIAAFKAYFEYALSVGFDLPETQIHHLANFSKGNLLFITLEPCPEFHDVFKRFAAVFEQTYTRFLDLQRAEAQARESKIQAALERVRSRSMGMQKSNEIREVIQVLYEQLVQLDFKIDNAGFLMDYRQSDDYNIWMADSLAEFPTLQHLPYFDHLINRDYIEQKTDGPELFTKSYSFEEKNSWLEVVLTYMPEATMEGKAYSLSAPGMAITRILLKNIGLYLINYHGTPYTDQDNATAMRFAKAFEETYTRFNDLKQAEEQLKESQIQAALERVRSRSMGMQKSEELREVIHVIYEQLNHLGLAIHGAGFTIDYRDTNDFDLWSADSLFNFPVKLHIPYFDHPLFNRFVEAKQNNRPNYDAQLTMSEKNTFWDHFFKYAPETPAEAREAAYASPGFCTSTVLFPNVALFIYNFSSDLFSDNDNSVLLRFGKEFEQLYTRFNDLKNAEQNALEAKVEASLEKVRSRALSMQGSAELIDVASLLFLQMKELGFFLQNAVVIVIPKENNEGYIHYTANPDYFTAMRFDVPPSDHIIIRAADQAAAAGLEVFQREFYGEESKSLARWLVTETDYRNIPEELKKKFLDADVYCYAVALNKRSLIVCDSWGPNTFSEFEIDTLPRFGRVFEQAYTRFLDLQKAEAATLLTLKQSSIDRVRAEIASMRTAEDLSRITPLIFHELQALNVPFFRCGVFIVNDAEQQIRFYLSTPEGKSLGVLLMHFDDMNVTRSAITHWRNNQLYVEHWDQQQFLAFTHMLLKDGQIPSAQSYQGGEKAPERLTLQFIPFKQGMLYIGSVEELADGHISLAKDLANAFSVAYARYEDFRQLEGAKLQIENTLTELKSAQSQLVQSEKMASLGELTAGIAHEIQNPLNFVNNFSDVSRELVDEMNEELEKGDVQQARLIANDIKQNLDKINHHGRRADSIVKGMLEHSRLSTGEKKATDINKLADEYLRLSYHGMRSKDKSFNADIVTFFDPGLGSIEVAPQDVGRVILNLVNNAFYAVYEKQKQSSNGYKPVVTVTTRRNDKLVEITVADNGNGIPDRIKEKIFQPFFTTKPTGQGTGLGLSLSYDIIKAHGGEIRVQSTEGGGTAFVIQLSGSRIDG